MAVVVLGFHVQKSIGKWDYAVQPAMRMSVHHRIKARGRSDATIETRDGAEDTNNEGRVCMRFKIPCLVWIPNPHNFCVFHVPLIVRNASLSDMKAWILFIRTHGRRIGQDASMANERQPIAIGKKAPNVFRLALSAAGDSS